MTRSPQDHTQEPSRPHSFKTALAQYPFQSATPTQKTQERSVAVWIAKAPLYVPIAHSFRNTNHSKHRKLQIAVTLTEILPHIRKLTATAAYQGADPRIRTLPSTAALSECYRQKFTRIANLSHSRTQKTADHSLTGRTFQVSQPCGGR